MEPQFSFPDRPSRLDPFAEKLTGWLRQEAGKSRKQKQDKKADACRPHAWILTVPMGVWRHLRAGRLNGRSSSRPRPGHLHPSRFAAGEAFQFDWSEDWAVVAGERTKLQVAHTKLSHSRVYIVQAYLLQTHEMLFDALAQAFRVLGGVPQRGIFDNMRTAVDSHRLTRQSPAGQCPLCGHGQPLSVRDGFLQSGIGLGEGASREERAGCTARLWQPLPSFPDLADFNAWLRHAALSNGGRFTRRRQDRCRCRECGHLPDALGRPFDGFVEHTKRVSPTCLVNFERNRYSVPASFANRR